MKITCKCRKPEIGLINQAVKEFNIDASNSFFIGDTTIDAKAAENAGIKFLGVSTGYGCKDERCKVDKQFMVFKNVHEAAKSIFHG